MSSNQLIRFDNSSTSPQTACALIHRGAGLSVYQVTNKIGVFVESVCTFFYPGPEVPKSKIDRFFLERGGRETALDELYKDTGSNLSKQHGRLRRYCQDVLKFAVPESHTANTQLVTFRIIVAVITRYPGIRRLFHRPKVSELEPLNLRRLWTRRDHASSCGLQWKFCRDFAIYCLHESAVTKLVENELPSGLGRLHDGPVQVLLRSCRLLTWEGECNDRLCAIHYLAGALEMPNFWKKGFDDFWTKKKLNDRELLSNFLADLCKMVIFLVNDTMQSPDGADTLAWILVARDGVKVLVRATLKGFLQLYELRNNRIRQTSLDHVRLNREKAAGLYSIPCADQLSAIVLLLKRSDVRCTFSETLPLAGSVDAVLQHIPLDENTDQELGDIDGDMAEPAQQSSTDLRNSSESTRSPSHGSSNSALDDGVESGFLNGRPQQSEARPLTPPKFQPQPRLPLEARPRDVSTPTTAEPTTRGTYQTQDDLALQIDSNDSSQDNILGHDFNFTGTPESGDEHGSWLKRYPAEAPQIHVNGSAPQHDLRSLSAVYPEPDWNGFASLGPLSTSHSFVPSPTLSQHNMPQQDSQGATPDLDRLLYTHREQLRLFREAVSLPREGAGPFIPQQMYKPHTTSDRKRYVEDVRLEAPIYFIVELSNQYGISLHDALHSRVKNILNREQVVFEGRGPSVSIRLEWPGYKQWSRQIPTKDFRSPPGPITIAKLAKNVAKCVQRFMLDRKAFAMEDGADDRWRIGDGPNDIKLEDLMLVSIHHVSLGSWQPHLRLRRPQSKFPVQSSVESSTVNNILMDNSI